MNILLIEDNEEMAKSVVSGFQEQGYHVDHAADGIAGFQLACEPGYQVIVVDRMVGPNGWVDGARCARRRGRSSS